jgi:hypothetical protein
MWNIYIIALVFLYAPSHKNWNSEATDATPGSARLDGTRTGTTTGLGCQMDCFQTKNPNLGKIWRVLQWKMLVYFMAILVYFMAMWSILWPFCLF